MLYPGFLPKVRSRIEAAEDLGALSIRDHGADLAVKLERPFHTANLG